jgi:SAM-dependent methyltransferase
MSRALYDDAAYARKYRDHDDTLDTSRPYRDLVAWLQDASRRFDAPFDALDLGCGTGRYFWALPGARSVTGVDRSAPMLAKAASPVHADLIAARRVALVRGDLSTIEFSAGAFDFVYSVGVLAEHAPLDADVVSRVARWLRPGGRFAFTTVHLESPSIPRTPLRRLATGVSRVLPAPLDAPLRMRLLTHGLYADERRVEELMSGRFHIESLDRFVSEAHLHCRCIGVRS